MKTEQVWFITGAGSGLGAGTAKAALEKGYKVVATARNLEKLRKAMPDTFGDNLLMLQLDVTDVKQVNDTIEKTVAEFGRIDVLINNAGYSLGGPFEAYTNEQLEQQMATNFYGAVNTMRASLPVMRKQRAGHIINITSVAGVVGMEATSAYCASKFALEGFSLSVKDEVAKFGIKITIVEPGFFRTDLLDANNAKIVSTDIEDYKETPDLAANMSRFHGTQMGDPYKFGKAMTELAAMDTPPYVFAAGSDAFPWVKGYVEGRLQQMDAFKELSYTTDGNWE